MFNPSRDEARRFFFDTWKKYRAGAPLTDLERIALGVIGLHGEYQALLEDEVERARRAESADPGAGSERSLRRQARGAGLAPRPAHDEHRSGGVLVVLLGPPGHSLEEARGHPPVADRAPRQADVRDDDLACVEPPRRHDDAIRPAHAFANEPAIMLRLIGVVAAIAIMIAAALISA